LSVKIVKMLICVQEKGPRVNSVRRPQCPKAIEVN